ncbi:DUF6705 family protein [uncultured Winogradskyella sp.]|uniref:DUF6705 family protein n=1 Tax=uncultured Winogradskyella sp. TaxID=395353 RepID=UPI00260CE4BD|nr:DUF6705 family protein [uncultured Winogradskyella sp.]
MKNSIYTLLILLLFSCKSQQVSAQYSMQNLTPFIGTWEYQEGNQIFRVTIYEDNLHLKGDYWLIEVINGAETILYESDYYAPGTDFHWGYTIFGGSNDGNLMGAKIDDNSIGYENGVASRKRKRGSLSLTIQQQSCLNCPVTAEWKVTELQGLKITGESENYNIPKDIIMTKME